MLENGVKFFIIIWFGDFEIKEVLIEIAFTSLNWTNLVKPNF